MKNPITERGRQFLEIYLQGSPYGELGVANDATINRLYFITGMPPDGWLKGNVGSYEYQAGTSWSLGFKELEDSSRFGDGKVKIYNIRDLIEKDEIEPDERDWYELG